jgi:hypothetical protein
MTKSPIVSDNEQECTSYFKSVIAEIPAFREAAIVDTDGKSHCSSIPFPQALDIGGRIEFALSLRVVDWISGALSAPLSPPTKIPFPRDGDWCFGETFKAVGSFRTALSLDETSLGADRCRNSE